MAPNDLLREFIADAYQKRCKRAKSISDLGGFILDFLESPKRMTPPGAIYGKGSALTISMWCKSLLIRGHTVPHKGRYALIVLSEIFELDLPVNHPAVVRNSRTTKRKVVRQAPFIPFNVAILFEKTAACQGAPMGLRVCCSIFPLMLLASLRFPDCKGS